MYRGWPARYAGPPRLGLLFGAVEVHLALGPLLLLGAGPLGIQKGLRSLGDLHYRLNTERDRARALPVLTTVALLLLVVYAW